MIEEMRRQLEEDAAAGRINQFQYSEGRARIDRLEAEAQNAAAFALEQCGRDFEEQHQALIDELPVIAAEFVALAEEAGTARLSASKVKRRHDDLVARQQAAEARANRAASLIASAEAIEADVIAWFDQLLARTPALATRLITEGRLDD